MPLDHLAAIRSDSARLVAALDENPDGAIPWCGDWTVKGCAQHVGAVHRMAARVVEGRPTADFSVRKQLEVPDERDPALSDWVASGTDELVAALDAASEEEPCWSWWPEATTVSFWHRRMAHETLVHRWDAERGAGVHVAATDPARAADAVDEHLDVFVGISRMVHSAPGAGESLHLHCTDTDGEWLLELPAAGERTLRREHAKGDVAVRGSAEALLLFVWGRLDAEAAGLEVIGDAGVVARWSELVPPM